LLIQKFKSDEIYQINRINPRFSAALATDLTHFTFAAFLCAGGGGHLMGGEQGKWINQRHFQRLPLYSQVIPGSNDAQPPENGL